MSKRKAPKQVEQFAALIERPRRLLRAQRTAHTVYTELVARCGPRASVQIRQATLATALGVHVNTITRAISVLTDMGLVEVRRTVRSAYYWLPDHPAYATDLAAYEARKAANAARRGNAPHIDPPHPHIDPPLDIPRSTTDGGSLSTTDGGSISIDVLTSRSIDVSSPSGGGPSGAADPSSALKEDRPPPVWVVDEPDQTKNGTQPKQSKDDPWGDGTPVPKQSEVAPDQTAPAAMTMSEYLWPNQSKAEQVRRPTVAAFIERAKDETRAHLLRKSRNVIAGNQSQKPSDDLLASLPGHWRFHDGEWFDQVGEDPEKMRRKPAKFAAERSGGWPS